MQSEHEWYLQTLLEAGGLVLCVFGDGGVGAAAFTGPGLPAAAGVPVLVGRLLDLRAHLHRLVRVSVHQGLGGEQAQVWTHIVCLAPVLSSGFWSLWFLRVPLMSPVLIHF